MMLKQALHALLLGLLLNVSSADPRMHLSSPRATTAFAIPRVSQRSPAMGVSTISRIQPYVHDISDATRLNARRLRELFSSSIDEKEEEDDVSLSNGDDLITSEESQEEETRRKKIRKKVRELANTFVVRPIVSTAPLPRAIAMVLKDATLSAVDMALEEVLARRPGSLTSPESTGIAAVDAYDVTALIDEAFEPMSRSLLEMEDALAKARASLAEAKSQATQAIEAVQVAAIAQAAGAATAVAAAEEVASQKVMADIFETDEIDVSTLTYDEVGYHQSEMQPPFLDEASCLIPGEAVVRVEKAPENSRRIFAGIDIYASIDDVWKVRYFATYLCSRALHGISQALVPRHRYLQTTNTCKMWCLIWW